VRDTAAQRGLHADRQLQFRPVRHEGQQEPAELSRSAAGGHTDSVINDAALDYMRDHTFAGPLVQQLATHEQRRFADEKAWAGHS
jgi:hypothetical protein